MGVTIKSKNHSIDMGFHGFHHLRARIAYLCNEEFGKHYEKCTDGLYLSNIERIEFYSKYDKVTDLLNKKYNYKYDDILYFLYQSDCEGEISYKICEKIYDIIKDYDDDVLYGYKERQNCAMFKDFKEIIQDCICYKCDMEWY